MLQNNPILARIKTQLPKRVIGELAKKAADAAAEYATFWGNFGAVLKEGLYEDREQQESLLPLIRFNSTEGDDLVSFEDYVGRMKPGQEAIYYLTGDKLDLLKKSPQLGRLRARGVEVLLLTDPVDEFWMPALGKYKVAGKDGAKDDGKDAEYALKSITRGGADLSKIATKDGDAKADDTAGEKKPAGNIGALIAIFKLALGEAVKDVRTSDPLTDSAVCLVADEGDMGMHMERLLKQHRQLDATAKRILQINPKNALVERLAAIVGHEGAADQLGEVDLLVQRAHRIVVGEGAALVLAQRDGRFVLAVELDQPDGCHLARRAGLRRCCADAQADAAILFAGQADRRAARWLLARRLDQRLDAAAVRADLLAGSRYDHLP